MALSALLLTASGGLSAGEAGAQEVGRIVHADVVALDHLIVYNRFGSFNPYGMIFALKRNVSALDAGSGEGPDAEACGEMTGAEGGTGPLEPGEVRLRDCLRPRPLVLRANVGDTLEVTVTNLLRPDQPGLTSTALPPSATDGEPGLGFCEDAGAGSVALRDEVGAAFAEQCRTVEADGDEAVAANGYGTDWPLTRNLSFVIPGLEPVPVGSEIHPACVGTGAVAPGASFTCRWRLPTEGTHLVSSYAAPAGGEADGGSLIHGLFGALIVERAGAQAFRSQVSPAAFDRVWPKSEGPVRHARQGTVDYFAAVPDSRDAARAGRGFDCGVQDVPVLAMLRPCIDAGETAPVFEIVHSDLNAIVVPETEAEPLPVARTEASLRERRLAREAAAPFREFTVIFHDELKTFYADDLKALGRYGQLAGVRDGFAINYGSSGVGAAVLANRLGIGPAGQCAECLYEEFFLESWANGDPALLEVFPDDPSNVHHSYLNDKVVFRNLHAGKETHVFHLHSHQWFAGNDSGRGAYLDSQTIAPQQGLTYRIYQGGLDRFAPRQPDGSLPEPKGYWASLGTGNRNRTPGDAIFHCHLYPHFAQGMWALWRVHDVLEDGTRLLPDGQVEPSLSVEPRGKQTQAEILAGATTPRREGSVGPQGEWREPGAARQDLGTPIPGLVPLPANGLPLLPTYADTEGPGTAMPGYPFYIPGVPGHRTPQPPLDMAEAANALEPNLAAALGRPRLDGGLPRHVVTAGRSLPGAATDEQRERFEAGEDPVVPIERMLALGDMTSEFGELRLELLPHAGTRLERSAMRFHHDGAAVKLRDAHGAVVAAPDANAGAYDVPTAGVLAAMPAPVAAAGSAPLRPRPSPPAMPPTRAFFPVNGAPPAPGAPFADPCGAPSVMAGSPFRRFDAATGSWARDPQAFAEIADPLRAAEVRMVPDPGLLGFRRFKVSAVDVDLVVNRAGWHDPQGRINVLSSQAGATKGRSTATAEPFYFRAFSGECIEVQHTNETAKALKLDDFQMKVPTDTIGQHIHLVKFDVTSSDGSGNGFNYEDGTFSPQEVLARICHSRGRATKRDGEDPSSIDDIAERTDAQCAARMIETVHKLDRFLPENIQYFQTTVQRWFADPILSYEGLVGRAGEGAQVADRTLRTVFTHDHFGPSNIQQHGFYSALLIEPSTHVVCPLPRPGEEAAPPELCVAGPATAQGASPPVPTLATEESERLVGARANVFTYKDNALEQPGDRPRLGDPAKQVAGDPLQVDAREYALAIADFALLYDGRRETNAPLPVPQPAGDLRGLDRLVAEALDPATSPSPDDVANGEAAPALDLALRGTPLSPSEARVTELAERWREIRREHGRPIAPPARPEAISADHHDPYLVNYRGEPIPLRVGGDRNGLPPPFAASPCGPAGAPSLSPSDNRSIVRQRGGEAGDMANIFRSDLHGDPCTPVLEALSGERLVVRLIQGAQEVQHIFTVEGRTIRRNVDQPFPAERHESERSGPRSRSTACLESPFGRSGRPGEFPGWSVGGYENQPFWNDMETFVAGCDNPLGFVAAHEVGISEHFEFGSLVASGVNNQGASFAPAIGSNGSNDGRGASSLVASVPDGRPSLDLLYHFGSTDALWNGAWGLIRTYDGPGEADAATCLSTPPRTGDEFERCLDPVAAGSAVGRRLVPLPVLRRQWRATTSGAPVPATPTIAPTVPAETSSLKAWCPLDGDRVPVIAAAVRAGEVLPKDDFAVPGTIYGAGPRQNGLFDPDGLMLVPLSLADLGLDRAPLNLAPYYDGGSGMGLYEAFANRQDATLAGLDARAIRAIIRRKLDAAIRPGDDAATQAAKRATIFGMPFVLRVAAGDCADLLLINALSATGAIWDQPGDALMPPIVPLNVDRRQTGGSFELVPSRHVALSLPLTTPMLRPGGLQAVGVNEARAVPPGGSSRPFWTVTRYFAGFAWASENRLDQLLDPGSGSGLDAALRAAAGLGAGEAMRVVLRSSEENGCATQKQITVFGLVLCVYDIPEEQTGFVQRALDAFFAEPGRADRVFVSIPYAFGALPIRSLGDIVSHGVHGLSGTLVVEPKGSTPTGSSAERFTWRHAPAALVPVPAVTVVGDPGDATHVPEAILRERVLLWQDGLNLWRRASAVAALPGWSGRPLPDCVVCDDSYDRGEQGVDYRSAPFRLRIAGTGGADAAFGTRGYPDRGDGDDLNAVEFAPDFLARRFASPQTRPLASPEIAARPQEEIAVRIALPQGRARQRAFVSTGFGYDDLMPGFGSGHSALLGPGKAMTAFGCAPQASGEYLWRDGPQHIFAAGVWGYLAVSPNAPGEATPCKP